MSVPTLIDVSAVMAAIASQLELELGPQVDGLQGDPKIVWNPTPPCIDILPADPFIERATFGPGGGYEAVYTVRARVTTADQQAGQELLLQLLDPHGPLSMWAALEADSTLGGVVQDSNLESVSGFQPYEAPGGVATGGSSGALLGCEWRLRVVL
jgi:hypothetical protein